MTAPKQCHECGLALDPWELSVTDDSGWPYCDPCAEEWLDDSEELVLEDDE